MTQLFHDKKEKEGEGAERNQLGNYRTLRYH